MRVTIENTPAVHFMVVDDNGNYQFLNRANDYNSAVIELEKIARHDFRNCREDTAARSYVLIDWANNFSEIFVYDFSIQVNVNAYRG